MYHGMRSVSRFKSPNGVTYPYPASRTWGIGLPLLLLGLGFSYKILSITIAFKDGVLIPALSIIMLMSAFIIWMGAASVIGALRRSIGVTVTSEGVSSTTIFGTRWAEWSSLGSFTEGTFNGGRQGVLPCVNAPIIGLGASKGLRRKKTFLIVDVFGIPASDLAAEINAARPGSDTLAPDAAAARSSRIVAGPRRLSVRTVIVTGIAIVVFCLQFYRLLTN
jgi:hypothetical protein